MHRLRLSSLEVVGDLPAEPLFGAEPWGQQAAQLDLWVSHFFPSLPLILPLSAAAISRERLCA